MCAYDRVAAVFFGVFGAWYVIEKSYRGYTLYYNPLIRYVKMETAISIQYRCIHFWTEDCMD